MTNTDILIMVLLALILVCTVATMLTKRLLTAIVIYMTFSLIMAVVWALLQAPDLAITEAAVGAGITSILYFVTLDKIKRIEEISEDHVKIQ